MTLRLRIAKMEAAMNIGDEKAQLQAKLNAMTYEELQSTILDFGRRVLETEDGTPDELASVAQTVAEIEAEMKAQEAWLQKALANPIRLGPTAP